MIINENGWGDKKAPKEEVKKPKTEAPAEAEVKEDAKQK
jgi:hypothetical protein